ncbi:MAG: hypothetical protein EBQ95_02890 [Gammaproteobacteria bacterium]|nr:hypothetical protein [Gammaproteobacteria bacterium]
MSQEKDTAFDLFKKAPASPPMQNDLDLKTLVGLMIHSIEEANNVFLRVSKFSKNPVSLEFIEKLSKYMGSLSTIVESENKPSETPSRKSP